MQLFFAFLYMNDNIRPKIQKLVVVEPIMVFFVFYFRDFWPSSR